MPVLAARNDTRQPDRLEHRPPILLSGFSSAAGPALDADPGRGSGRRAQARSPTMVARCATARMPLGGLGSADVTLGTNSNLGSPTMQQRGHASVQQSVEHAHALAVHEQLVDDYRPDGSSSSGDLSGRIGREDRLRRRRGEQIGIEGLGLAHWTRRPRPRGG